ncbi:hypothetical protein NADFUDRAFT_77279 [Nadsonia fulvescens var. elongata DSM 6958]|uniref:Uncharacterized protein n=1 Tax=Nadsonia fulvescens var. elongata DSM 6958 TaxID=857566 RepID=A0A1E3PPB3_9ASCO|nr:hypothetical protein NADFUDRAFT_77279 [Nadsonia fulvescens var. elongata DSM 6958]
MPELASDIKSQKESEILKIQNYKATCPFTDCLCKILSTPNLSKANLQLIQFLSKPDEGLPDKFPRILKKNEDDNKKDTNSNFDESYEDVIPADLMQKQFMEIIKELPSTQTEDNMIIFDQELFYGFDDPYKFDNIGVTKPVLDTNTNRPFVQTVRRSTFNTETNELELTTGQVVRFLSCGDCDRGPLGIVIQTMPRHNELPKLEFMACVKSLFFEKV